MFGIRELNVAIELWGAVFCLVAIVCVFFLTQADRRYRSLLLTMFFTNLFYMCGDAIAGVFCGKPGIVAFMATRAGNLLTFLMGYLLVGSVFFYLCARLHEATERSFRRECVAMALACDLWCIMAICGVFCFIDAQNVYHRSEWYWLGLIPIVAVSLISTVLVIYHRSKLPHREVSFLLLYSLLPVPACFIQMFIYGLNYTAIASTIGLVVVLLENMAHSAWLLANRTEQLAQSREELAESRIAVMVSQIQPHFLFNTLDSIYYLCVTDSCRAADAVDKFSTYLRANLDSLNRTTPVPISMELAHVRTYLELEKISKAELLEFRIDAQAQNFLVPALCVQTIVENAVRHGVSKRPEGGSVTVCTEERADAYYVIVHDDGVGFDVDQMPSTGHHMGIQNSRARLAAMCDGSLEVQSIPSEGTTATLCIPKKELA